MIRSTPSARVAVILNRGPGSPERIQAELRHHIIRRVVGMGLPSAASFLLLSVYDLIDVFWLAKIGEAPVAAVTMFGALYALS